MRAQIHIIGPASLQNAVMAEHISRETGHECQCHRSFDPHVAQVGIRACQALLLWDCLGTGIPHSPLGVADLVNSCKHLLLAYFNLPDNSEHERLAMQSGAHGVFHDSTSMEHLTRGIRAILAGDLWFSRKAMASCILESRSNGNGARHDVPPAAALTEREREILTMLASGKVNADIARALFISVNTVKTHLCNVYAKIGVKNRVEAAFWATQNL